MSMSDEQEAWHEKHGKQQISTDFAHPTLSRSLKLFGGFHETKSCVLSLRMAKTFSLRLPKSCTSFSFAPVI
jgi:hypothetical protein